jgi:hypothetical protein
VYYAICENRSFRDKAVAEAAAAKALSDMLGLESDGTPVFAAGSPGFADEQPLHAAGLGASPRRRRPPRG